MVGGGGGGEGRGVLRKERDRQGPRETAAVM